jgi:hypothetical protein
MIQNEGGLLGKRRRDYPQGDHNLFGDNKLTPADLGLATLKDNKGSVLNSEGAAYLSRYGFRDMIMRNRNLVKLIDKPQEAVHEIETELATFGNERGANFEQRYLKFIKAGFDQRQAAKRADKMEACELEALTAVLKKKYPYFYGGGPTGSNPFNVLALTNTKARKAQKIAETV